MTVKFEVQPIPMYYLDGDMVEEETARCIVEGREWSKIIALCSITDRFVLILENSAILTLDTKYVNYKSADEFMREGESKKEKNK